MAMSGTVIEAAIRAAFPDAEIRLTDLAGDGDHWAIHVACQSFAGLSRVKQHQLVYAALGGRVGGELHALQVTTSIPAADGHSGV